jgi:hypothetical protein
MYKADALKEALRPRRKVKGVSDPWKTRRRLTNVFVPAYSLFPTFLLATILYKLTSHTTSVVRKTSPYLKS